MREAIVRTMRWGVGLSLTRTTLANQLFVPDPGIKLKLPPALDETLEVSYWRHWPTPGGRGEVGCSGLLSLC